VATLAVGAPGDANWSEPRKGGRVFLLFLAADGSILSHVEIGNGVGGLPQVLDTFDLFGCALDALGDLDGDGVVDLVAGSRLYSAEPWPVIGVGAIYVLFLNAEISVFRRFENRMAICAAEKEQRILTWSTDTRDERLNEEGTISKRRLQDCEQLLAYGIRQHESIKRVATDDRLDH